MSASFPSFQASAIQVDEQKISLSPIEANPGTRDLILCVDQWDGLTNVNGTGSYLEVVKKVYEPQLKVKIKFLPWARAQAEFRNKKCDGLIAENDIDEAFVKPHIILDALELEAYYLKGKLKFKGQESLKKERVGWLRGYGFNKLVPYSISFSEVNDVKAGFKMLEGERFNIFLDYSYTFKDECQTSGVDCSKITSKPSGVIERVWVVFHNSPRGKGLARTWDDKMSDLIKAGVPQKIFEKYGQKYPGPY
ncbi:hypothetical protein [Bdellovibrio sp. HCB2-146]|uniref:hypothetical protein n=1 Tax=Bdellovibrio sp. HCB2-146 TaxID=3394362 RepID=UPI0039BC554C